VDGDELLTGSTRCLSFSAREGESGRAQQDERTATLKVKSPGSVITWLQVVTPSLYSML
jgi:hypothetical protein